MKLVFKEEAYEIIGACFEVYKQKGCGFTEAVYQECLAIEFDLRSIPFVEQPQLELGYKGNVLKHRFRPDFICYEKIVVELKAVPNLIEANQAQTLNYLSATEFDLALLINFGHFPKLEYKRLASSRGSSRSSSIRSELQTWRKNQK